MLVATVNSYLVDSMVRLLPAVAGEEACLSNEEVERKGAKCDISPSRLCTKKRLTLLEFDNWTLVIGTLFLIPILSLNSELNSKCQTWARDALSAHHNTNYQPPNFLSNL